MAATTPEIENSSSPAAQPSDAPASADALEKVRQEEKSKLYAEMQDLRARLEQASAEVTSKEQEYKRQIDDLQKQLSVLQKAASGNFDPVALAREVADDTRKILMDQHNAKLAELTDRLNRLEREKELARLESIRQKLISEANGRIIQAMVRGNSEEELRASAEAAKQEFERIVTAHANSAPAPAAASTAPVPNAGPGAGDAIPIVQTGRLDTATYTKNRQKLLSDLKARHG